MGRNPWPEMSGTSFLKDLELLGFREDKTASEVVRERPAR
jgi:hypothetical protein